MEGSGPELPKPKKRNTKVIVLDVVIVVAVLAVLVLVLALVGNHGLSIASWSADRSMLGAGGSIFTVEVKNFGDEIGSKTIWCKFTIGPNTYSASQSITLAPGETQTYMIFVTIPMADWFDSGSGRCYLA